MTYFPEEVKDTDACYLLQIKYCMNHNLPVFAMKQCFNCNMKLTNALMKVRTQEEALTYSSTKLITGCPNCGTTWCD